MVDRGIFGKNGAFPFSANGAGFIALTSSISKRFLPPNFQPGSWDVVCHNGKEPQRHVGNKRFKICIENYLRSHTKAATRSAKSAVISDIVSSIRESSAQEGGGFVRFDASHCLWYEVGDKVARDKVGQALRDSKRANTKEVREKKSKPCPSSKAPAVQCDYRPKKEKMELVELSSVEHSDKSNNVFYATTSMATEQTEGKLPKHSTSTVTFGSGSDGLTMLFHEIAMDDKPFILTKDNCTVAWPAQTDNIIEWFENDMQ